VHESMAALKISSQTRKLVELLHRQLRQRVLEQATYQHCPGIVRFFSSVGVLDRQQHSGLYRDKQSRHKQIFARQLEILIPDLLDVGQILLRYLGHGNIQHVEVLLANQIQKQIQRPLKRLEKNLESIRRNVKILMK